MPHPKRRHSSTRRDKRRTHDKLIMPQLVACPTTGELNLPHRAFWYEDRLYYQGKVVMDRSAS